MIPACVVWFSVYACGLGECVLHLGTQDAREASVLAFKLESVPGPYSINVSKWEECPDE